jgi:tRNA(Arg) A34 adenosine deaminase TadA
VVNKHERFMRLAIRKTIEGIREGQSPFGACIVKRGKVITCVHNTVWKSTDITAHAEIHAIRQACRKLNTIDLSECAIYSTCEPCPMCFSACHWAKVSTIVFGARIRDARATGFHELTISNRRMKSLAGSSIKVVEGLLRDEALNLFRLWSGQSHRRLY